MKPEVLVKIKKPHKLKDIDLSNKNDLIKPGEMGIGFALDCEVKKLKFRRKSSVIYWTKVFP